MGCDISKKEDEIVDAKRWVFVKALQRFEE
jgi:hypothetical protein